MQAWYLHTRDGIQYVFQREIPDPSPNCFFCEEHDPSEFIYSGMSDEEVGTDDNGESVYYRWYVCEDCLEHEQYADDEYFYAERQADRATKFYYDPTRQLFYLRPDDLMIARYEREEFIKSGQLLLVESD